MIFVLIIQHILTHTLRYSLDSLFLYKLTSNNMKKHTNHASITDS